MQTASVLTIFGVGSPYAWDVVDAALAQQLTVRCHDNIGGADTRLPELHTIALPGPFTIGLSSAGARAAVAHAAHEAGLDDPVALVHPFSSVASTATIKHGAFINAGAVIGSNSEIGCHVNINRSASVGHDNRIGFAVSIGPGAVLAGSVTIDAGAFIGAGAVILPGRTVGRNAIVGAGAVVTGDVADGEVVVGNPARVIRMNALEGLAACPHC